RERHGLRSLVLWGPGEEPLARAVCEAAGDSADLAPPTDLDSLAAYFRSAALVVANDTGPMPLAVATGAPGLALQLSRGAARWSPPGARFAGVRAEGPDAIQAALDAAARLLALTAGARAAKVAAPPAHAGGQEAK